MKIVLLVLLLIPIFLFQAFTCNEVLSDYKLQKKENKLKNRPVRVQKNKVYYRVK